MIINFVAHGEALTATYLPSVCADQGGFSAAAAVIRRSLLLRFTFRKVSTRSCRMREPVKTCVVESFQRNGLPPDAPIHTGWDQRECVQSLVKKAGYSGAITQGLLDGIKLTRYQARIACARHLQRFIVTISKQGPILFRSNLYCDLLAYPASPPLCQAMNLSDRIHAKCRS